MNVHRALRLPGLVLCLALVVAACTTATSGSSAPSTDSSVRPTGERVELINVSYDPTRELYEQYGQLFSETYMKKTGVRVDVRNSHGGSGSQARSVIDGLQADVVTLALAADTEAVAKRGLIHPGWQNELPNGSNPYVSTIVLLVKKGNPKGLKSWDDLGKSGVQVITPNPKTSGGARWNFLAAWASVTQNGGTEDAAKLLLGRIYSNVTVMDTGARASTSTFAEKGIGDVLIAWENEALLVLREHPRDFEIVYPPTSILAEPTVAVVDQVVEKKKTRTVAEEYLKFLYTDEAQELIAKNFYRPSNSAILEKYRDTFPAIKLSSIRDFGGWEAVQVKFFDDGAIFDQVYKPK